MVKGSSETTETTVPEEYYDLFERKSFAMVTTRLPNDAMHVTVVWVDYDGTHVLVNSARSRQKVKNVRHNPEVGMGVLDMENPYRYLWVAGTVEELTEEGGVKHANKLAQRYLGVDEYPYLGRDPERVILKIRPDICHGYTSRVSEDFDAETFV